MIVGLTGGIGCGKSTVLALFRELGCHTLNTDEVVARIYSEDEQTHHKLLDTFGREILTERGTIDKRALARLLQNTETAQRLNAIVHPVVREYTRKHYDDLLNIEKDPILIVEAPLLYEAGSTEFYDVIICVTCPREVGVKRFASARGLTLEEANLRADRQFPTQEKARRSDYVIPNSGTLEELRQKVQSGLYILQEEKKRD